MSSAGPSPGTRGGVQRGWGPAAWPGTARDEIDRVAERAGLRLFPRRAAPVLPWTRTQETFQIWSLGCVLCLLNILWVFHYFRESQFHTQHSGLSEHTLPQTQNHRSSPPTPRSPGLPALRHAALRAQHLRARDLQADGRRCLLRPDSLSDHPRASGLSPPDPDLQTHSYVCTHKHRLHTPVHVHTPVHTRVHTPVHMHRCTPKHTGAHGHSTRASPSLAGSLPSSWEPLLHQVRSH